MKDRMKRGYRKAVFIVTYRINKGRIEYLILRRKKHWRGWEFPKGGIELGEKEINAARRECFEESGLKPISIKKFQVRGKYKYSHIFRDRPSFIGQTYVLFACKVSEGRVKYDAKEHNYFLWLDFKEAIKKLKHNNQKRCLSIVNRSLLR